MDIKAFLRIKSFFKIQIRTPKNHKTGINLK